MRALFLALLLCFGCAREITIYEEPAPTQEQLLEKLTAATVQVFTTCESGKSSGSGVLIAWDTVATANHVVDEGCTYKIDGQEWFVVARDEPGDIALLKGVALRGEPVPLSEKPYLGTALIAVGYPSHPFTGKTQLQITTGVLSAKYAHRYKISAPIYFGSSGGPVFDTGGHLVGLSVSLWVKGGTPMPGEWFATPAYRIAQLQRRFSEHFSVDELACKCGMPVPKQFYPEAAEITRRAEKLRARTGHPLIVVSGYRTPEHNEKVGGAPRSYHLRSGALDLRSLWYSPSELAAFYEELVASGEVPDGGLGVYDKHLHIDIGKPRRWRK